jgi:hypothetical protein
VLALEMPTAAADLTSAITTAEVAKPMIAVRLGQAESVRLLPVDARGHGDGSTGPVVLSARSSKRRIAAYSYPENAARALAHAVGYERWRSAEHGQVPDFDDADPAGAHAIATAFLAANPDGGWLATPDAVALTACYGIPMVAADDVPGDGVETTVAVVQEPVFGPLVAVGLGGLAADARARRSARLTPLTDVDAAAMIAEVRAAPMLTGQAGSAAVDTAGLARLLLRVSRLADDLPAVAELDLDPVIAGPDGVYPVDVRVRLATRAPREEFARQLR